MLYVFPRLVAIQKIRYNLDTITERGQYLIAILLAKILSQCKRIVKETVFSIFRL